jgi:uncharacterized protein (DUF2062 family)
MLKKLKRSFKFLLIKLLRIKDKAHSVAIGFTMGLLINFVPSFGFGPVISVAIARIARGNTVAGFLGGISLIWAFPFLFYLNVLVGNLILPFDVAEIVSVNEENPAIEVGLHLGKAFFIGMFINIIIFGIVSYFSMLFIVTKYRKRILSYIYRVWLPQR